MLNSIEYDISTAYKNCNTEKRKIYSAFKFSDIVIIMLINGWHFYHMYKHYIFRAQLIWAWTLFW